MAPCCFFTQKLAIFHMPLCSHQQFIQKHIYLQSPLLLCHQQFTAFHTHPINFSSSPYHKFYSIPSEHIPWKNSFTIIPLLIQTSSMHQNGGERTFSWIFHLNTWTTKLMLNKYWNCNKQPKSVHKLKKWKRTKPVIPAQNNTHRVKYNVLTCCDLLLDGNLSDVT